MTALSSKSLHTYSWNLNSAIFDQNNFPILFSISENGTSNIWQCSVSDFQVVEKYFWQFTLSIVWIQYFLYQNLSTFTSQKCPKKLP